MKIFFSESLVDYATYTFNYAIYCKQENLDEIHEIYKKGFLPYSNSLELKEPHYYLARSLRVNLELFKETSENRRLDKKMNLFEPQVKLWPKDAYENNESFENFCLDYAKERFEGNMSDERLKYILKWPGLKHILEFKTKEGKLMGYVLGVISNDIFHYWFSFYDLSFPQPGLGKWMMYRTIKWAQENNYKEVYLGTCYGEKAMYKMRDFKGLEFFDGNHWNNDMKLLKHKCKNDYEATKDDFKKNLN
jgi:arginine-tRNA-protein transferase